MSYAKSNNNGATFAELGIPRNVVESRTVTLAPEDVDGYISYGYYRQVNGPYTGPPSCLAGYEPVPTLVGLTAEFAAIQSSEAECSVSQRERYAGLISGQIPDPRVQDTVQDPGVERDLIRIQSAATDKRRELDSTADADLPEFDPTLEVAPPQNGKAYARISIETVILAPWVGAPDNTYGIVSTLEIQKEFSDDGDEARFSILSSPSPGTPGGVDGPLPFVQDPANPQVWVVESRDGHKWAPADDGPVEWELRWGAGSIVVSRPQPVKGLHQRIAQNIRYATAGGAGGRKKPPRRR